MNEIACGHAKHVGHKREHNEDNYIADPEHRLFVVADGMGGHDCGEVASRIVVDFIYDEVRRGGPMQKAVGASHHVVLMAANQNLGLPGMGSTVVAAKLDDHKYEIVWVGDSRAYLWDGRNLQQLTSDHSFVQRLLDSGRISKAESANHPQRNIITQAIGSLEHDQVNAESVIDDFYRGEQILLCSDGLSDEASDSEIADVLSQDLTEQQKADTLVELALKKGGSDNITVVLVSAPEDAPEKARNDDTVAIDLTK